MFHSVIVFSPGCAAIGSDALPGPPAPRWPHPGRPGRIAVNASRAKAIVAWLLVVLLQGVAIPAVAQGSNEQAARGHFELGRKHYEAGEFHAAAEEFARANELMPSPELQYNMARAYEQLGALPQAVAAFEAYLRAVPDADDAKDVRARIAWMRATDVALRERGGRGSRQGALRLVLPETAAPSAVSVNGETLDVEDGLGIVWLDPGQHHVAVVGASGVPFDANVTVRAGRLTAARVSFPQAVASEEIAARASHSPWPVMLAALGGAALAAGTGLAAVGSANADGTLQTGAEVTWVSAAALLGVASLVYTFE